MLNSSIEEFCKKMGIISLSIDGEKVFEVPQEPKKANLTNLKQIRKARGMGLKKLSAEMNGDSSKWHILKDWEEHPEVYIVCDEFISQLCNALECTKEQLSGEVVFDI